MTTQLFESAVQRIDQESATIAAQFGGTSRPVTAGNNDPRHLARLAETERFIDDLRTGRRPLHHFTEAMSTADFPNLFADSLDRQLYGAYMATEPTWMNYARASIVNDFREVKRFATSGIRGLLTKVPELDEHKRRAQTEAEYSYSVDKYEAGFAVSFETMVNDDLGAFLRLPNDLAASARDSEEEFVTRLYCGASGPLASVYTAGNHNIVTSNAALERASLRTAITQLMKRTDERGNPIAISGVELVVGTGLSLLAEEIINTTQYRVVLANGDVRVVSGSGVGANLRINTNYWIDSVATTANADTSWWLFANPASTRPALEFGRLRGYEAPALYEKIPDSRRIGGGLEQWSFNNSASEKKVVHIFGGTFVDPKMTMASNGTGS